MGENPSPGRRLFVWKYFPNSKGNSPIPAIRWHHEFKPESPNANFVQNVYLANIIVNCYDVDQELRLDIVKIHPDVVNFIMDMMEDVGDWYSGLTEEIEAAYEFFLETES